MNMHELDIPYRNHLISIYYDSETELYQLMIRTGNGLEMTKYGEDWKKPIYQLNDIESLTLAMVTGVNILQCVVNSVGILMQRWT